MEREQPQDAVMGCLKKDKLLFGTKELKYTQQKHYSVTLTYCLSLKFDSFTWVLMIQDDNPQDYSNRVTVRANRKATQTTRLTQRQADRETKS